MNIYFDSSSQNHTKTTVEGLKQHKDKENENGRGEIATKFWLSRPKKAEN